MLSNFCRSTHLPEACLLEARPDARSFDVITSHDIRSSAVLRSSPGAERQLTYTRCMNIGFFARHMFSRRTRPDLATVRPAFVVASYLESRHSYGDTLAWWNVQLTKSIRCWRRATILRSGIAMWALSRLFMSYHFLCNRTKGRRYGAQTRPTSLPVCRSTNCVKGYRPVITRVRRFVGL